MRRIYVGNLSWDITKEELRQHFSSYGLITDAHVMVDRDTGRSRGFGFVTFETPEDARVAITDENGQEFRGRTLKVSEAHPRKNNRDNQAQMH